MLRRLGFAVALVALCVTVAHADKTVTYKTLTAADVVRVIITRNAAGGWDVADEAAVKDGSGAIAYRSLLRTPLTLSSGQKTTVDNFIGSALLAAHNTQEGL